MGGTDRQSEQSEDPDGQSPTILPRDAKRGPKGPRGGKQSGAAPLPVRPAYGPARPLRRPWAPPGPRGNS